VIFHAPHGVDLEYLRAGHGEPVTVFAHGLGNGIAETRPLGSGVTGTKIFFQFRGHGRSGAPEGAWTYADLAADLAAVADAFGASRALGVSLGAGALCRLVATAPERFERLVFFLPAALAGSRPPAAAQRLADLRAGGAALRSAIAAEVPAPLRDSTSFQVYLRQRTEELARHPLSPALGTLLSDLPVPDPAALREVRVPALVLGCEGDPLHPAGAARRLAEALGDATLHMYPGPGVLWTDRADLRQRISGFLSQG
jgi:3-oxoadipate enol-lactonase